MISIIIPTRGDRPQYLAQCLKMMKAQTIQPDNIILVDYKPLSNENDLADRYRKGIKRSNEAFSDLTFFIEDDDYYSPKYIETMINLWRENGRPSLFGLAETTYYHIGINKYKKIFHDGRASMFQTMISGDFYMNLKEFGNKNFDVNLWHNYKGNKKTSNLFNKIAMGIKHGTGICGGIGHREDIYVNAINDSDKNYLKLITNESFDFYNNTK